MPKRNPKDDSDAEEIVLGSQDSDDGIDYLTDEDPDFEEAGGEEQLEEGELDDFLEEEEEPLRPFRKTVIEYQATTPAKKTKIELAATKAKMHPPPAPKKTGTLRASTVPKLSNPKRQ